jgi:cytochrome P450
MEDVAYAFPVAVISTMLGVPPEDQRYLKPFIDQAFAARGDILRIPSSLPGLQEIYNYFPSLVENGFAHHGRISLVTLHKLN